MLCAQHVRGAEERHAPTAFEERKAFAASRARSRTRQGERQTIKEDGAVRREFGPGAGPRGRGHCESLAMGARTWPGRLRRFFWERVERRLGVLAFTATARRGFRRVRNGVFVCLCGSLGKQTSGRAATNAWSGCDWNNQANHQTCSHWLDPEEWGPLVEWYPRKSIRSTARRQEHRGTSNASHQ
jgi:hypothetical protein